MLMRYLTENCNKGQSFAHVSYILFIVPIIPEIFLSSLKYTATWRYPKHIKWANTDAFFFSTLALRFIIFVDNFRTVTTRKRFSDMIWPMDILYKKTTTTKQLKKDSECKLMIWLFLTVQGHDFVNIIRRRHCKMQGNFCFIFRNRKGLWWWWWAKYISLILKLLYKLLAINCHTKYLSGILVWECFTNFLGNRRTALVYLFT